MSRTYTPLTDALAAYVREVSVREPDVLKRLRESTEDHPEANCQISPEQGQLLQLLARLVGARKVLEVGTFMGYSSTWVALAMPAGSKLIACDRSEEYTSVARRTWREAGVEDRIELRLGPALATLDRLLAEGHGGTFDLIFIDADKLGYLDYYERSMELVRQGGLIVADNVLRHGAPADPADHAPDTEAIRAFNRRLHGDARIAMSLATVGDGFAIAYKL